MRICYVTVGSVCNISEIFQPLYVQLNNSNKVIFSFELITLLTRSNFKQTSRFPAITDKIRTKLEW